MQVEIGEYMVYGIILRWQLESKIILVRIQQQIYKNVMYICLIILNYKKSALNNKKKFFFLQ